jgi:nicotinate-nucleotide adenylyltransferase
VAGKLFKSMERKKIGIYGGTFNPIHLGHVNLALELQERHCLDEVWFIPTSLNPHKIDNDPPVSAQDRLEMVKLAIADIPTFYLKDLELHRAGPSYTIDTLRTLIQEPTPHQYYLLLGEDAISGFFHWKLVNEIVDSIPLLIGTRTGNWMDFNPEGHEPKIVEAIRKGITQTRCMDISSTDIRERIKKDLYCGHLLPANVLKYIGFHSLFKRA